MQILQERVSKLDLDKITLETDLQQRLERIAKEDSIAVIAGGFARDAVFKKPYRDIDIFIHTEPSNQAYIIEEVIPEVFKDICSSSLAVASENNYGGYFYVYDIPKTSYQFILLDRSIEYTLTRFDLSFNQVYFSSDGKLNYSANFLNTIKTGKVIINYEIDRGRLQRLQKKYSEFSFIPKGKSAVKATQYNTLYYTVELDAPTPPPQQLEEAPF